MTVCICFYDSLFISGWMTSFFYQIDNFKWRNKRIL